MGSRFLLRASLSLFLIAVYGQHADVSLNTVSDAYYQQTEVIIVHMRSLLFPTAVLYFYLVTHAFSSLNRQEVQADLFESFIREHGKVYPSTQGEFPLLLMDY